MRAGLVRPPACLALAVLATSPGCRADKDTGAAPPRASAEGAAVKAASGYHSKADLEVAYGIEVRVRFTGTRRPTGWDIPPMVRSQCGGADRVADEALVVSSDGGLEDTVVWLDDIHEGAPLPRDASATQDERRCVLTPHVLAMPASGTLTLTNGDPANHAVRFEFTGRSEANGDSSDDFMKTLPAGGTHALEVNPDWAGRYARVVCPIHLWMWGYVHFFEHPYFGVTKGGVARLERVPPGHYHVAAWHEGIGLTYASSLKFSPSVMARAEVTVGNGDANVGFVMGDDGLMVAAPPPGDACAARSATSTSPGRP